MQIMNKSCYIGDVTALHVAQLGPNPNDIVLLAGCGPALQAYSLSDGGGLLLSQQLFEGGRIHGITTVSSAEAAGGPGDPRKGDGQTAGGAVAQPVCAPVGCSDRVTYAVFWGGCGVQVLRLELLDAGQGGLAAHPEAQQRQRQVLLASTCVRLPPRPSWVLTARLLQLCGRGTDGPGTGGEGSSSSDAAAVVGGGRTSGYVSEAAAQGRAEASGQGAYGEATAPGAMLLLLGLAGNSVEVWSVDPVGPADRPAAGVPLAKAAGDGAALLVSARCCSQLQLFSMALLPLRLPCGDMRVWVAAGTMFNQVLLWRLPRLPLAPASCSGDQHAPAPASTYLDSHGGASAQRSPAGRAMALTLGGKAAQCEVHQLAVLYDSLDERIRQLERRLGVGAPGGRGPGAAGGTWRPLWGARGAQQGAQPPGGLHQGTEDGQRSEPAAYGDVQRVRCPVLCTLRGHEGAVFWAEWVKWPGLQGMERGRPAQGDEQGLGRGAGETWQVNEERADGSATPTATASLATVMANTSSSTSTNSGSGPGGTGGWMLATTSDDRSARVWALPDLSCWDAPHAAHAPRPRPPLELRPWRTLWGHTSRVWCCAAVPCLQPATPPACTGAAACTVAGAAAPACAFAAPLGCVPLLVTGSEDCTARVWDVQQGRCLATLQGHRGRGIWRCTLLSAPRSPAPHTAAPAGASLPVLVTAGADSAIRLWPLAERLQLQQPAAASAASAGQAGAHSAGVQPPGAAGGDHSPGVGVTTYVIRPDWPTSTAAGDLSVAPAAAVVGGGGPGPGTARVEARGSEGVRCLALLGHCHVAAATYSGHVYVRRLGSGAERAGDVASSVRGGLAAAPGAGDTVMAVAAAEAGGLRRADGYDAGGEADARWQLVYGSSQHGPCTCLEAWRVEGWGAAGGLGPAVCAAAAAGNDNPLGWLLAVGHSSGQLAVVWLQEAQLCGTGTSASSQSTGATAGAGAGAVAAAGGCGMLVASWRATGAGSVIGAWWVRALGPGVLLSVGGDAAAVRLWALPGLDDPPHQGAAPSPPCPPSTGEGFLQGGAERRGQQEEGQGEGNRPRLVAVARSPLRGRLLVGDVCWAHGVLLAGDQQGNVLGFALPQAVREQLSARQGRCGGGGGGGGARAGEAGPRRGEEVGAAHEEQFLTCFAVFREALGPAPASWVRVAGPGSQLGTVGAGAAAPSVFTVAGRDGVIVQYRCTASSSSSSGSGSAGDLVHGNTAAAGTAGAACPQLVCISLQSRTGVAAIEFADAPQPHLGHNDASPSVSARPGHSNGTGATTPTASTAAPTASSDSLLVAGFRGSDFLLYSGAHGAELMRVPGCGGWRRTHALRVSSPDLVTFAHVLLPSNPREPPAIRVVQKAPPPSAAARGSSPGPQGGQKQQGHDALTRTQQHPHPQQQQRPLPRSLHVPHHGREVLCALLLPGRAPPPAATAPAAARERPGTSGSRGGMVVVPPPLVVLTGAEDGSLRTVTAAPAPNGAGSGAVPPGGRYGLCFSSGAVAGEHAAGTAVRCLAAAPLGRAAAAALGFAEGTESGPDGGVAVPYLVVSAGVKEVLMAWLVCVGHLQQQQPQQQDKGLEGLGAAGREGSAEASSGAAVRSGCQWLSTRPPPKGLRPRSVEDARQVLSGDRRFLSLSLLGVEDAPAAVAEPPAAAATAPGCGDPAAAATAPPPAAPEPTALLAVSSSDASCGLVAWGLRSRAWRPVGRLAWHQHPVLASAHVEGHADAEGPTGHGCGLPRQEHQRHVGQEQPVREAVTTSPGGAVPPQEGGQEHAEGVVEAAEGGYWLATGDTGGSVALWWVPRALHRAGQQGDMPERPGEGLVRQQHPLRHRAVWGRPEGRGRAKGQRSAVGPDRAAAADDTPAALEGAGQQQGPLSEAVEACGRQQPDGGGEGGLQGQQGRDEEQPGQERRQQQEAPVSLRPVLAVRGVHGSGVNALVLLHWGGSPGPDGAGEDLSRAEEPQQEPGRKGVAEGEEQQHKQGRQPQEQQPHDLVVVSGGDDQALCVLRVRVRLETTGPGAAPGSGGVWRAAVLGLCRVPLAHASAVRGLEVCGAAQRLAPHGQQQGDPPDGTPCGGRGGGAAGDGGGVALASVGLDQVLQTWTLRPAAPGRCGGSMTGSGSGAGQATGRASRGGSPVQGDGGSSVQHASYLAVVECGSEGAGAGALAAAEGCTELQVVRLRRELGDEQSTGGLAGRGTAAGRGESRGSGPGNTGGHGVQGLQAWRLEAEEQLEGVGQYGCVRYGPGSSTFSDGVGCAVGGPEPLVLRREVAVTVDVPEPACMAALPLGGVHGRPYGLGGDGRSDARMGGLGEVVLAVAGRGLQLLEGR